MDIVRKKGFAMKYVVIVLLAGLIFCCGQRDKAPAQDKVIVPDKVVKAEKQEPAPVVQETPQSEELAQVHAILAKADALDGTEDHIVHKCAGCNLNMEGSSEHIHTYAGYELYHCSEGCKAEFLKDPKIKILALASRVK
jgi:YHS domain-containing protein